MFVSKNVSRLARNVHNRCNPIVRTGLRSLSGVTLGDDKSTSLPPLHLTISELYASNKVTGLRKAMKLVKSVSESRPDMSLVGYLSVIDICLEMGNVNDALKAFMEVRKLGFVIETPMAEKFIQLALLRSNYKAIEAIMRTQPITAKMMASLAEPMILGNRFKKYLEFLRKYLFSKPPPKPVAVAKVMKYFLVAKIKLGNAGSHQAHDSLLEAKQAFTEYFDVCLDNQEYEGVQLEALQEKIGDFEEMLVLDELREVGEFEGEEDEDENEELEELNSDEYDIRESINDLNACNCHVELDVDSLPGEFEIHESHPSLEDVPLMSSHSRAGALSHCVPLPEALYDDSMLQERVSVESPYDDLLSDMPDNFSIPVGEFEEDGQLMSVQMHFVRTGGLSSGDRLGSLSDNIESENWNEVEGDGLKNSMKSAFDEFDQDDDDFDDDDDDDDDDL